MYIFDAKGKKVELIEVQPRIPERAGIIRRGAALPQVPTSIVTSDPEHRAFRAFFEIDRGTRRAAKTGSAKLATAAKLAEVGPPPTIFREAKTGLVRTFHRELVIRFAPNAAASKKKMILKKFALAIRYNNRYISDQIVAYDAKKSRDGNQLVEAANECTQLDEVLFATPNFVSEYRRHAIPTIPRGQWHLQNRGKVAGQVVGEDVDARAAWKITQGKRSIVVAVLDDGVDIDHALLTSRIWRNPNKNSPDMFGRDFFVPDEAPDHFNPRPKKFRFPFDEMDGNDIHGTPCAGVIAASGPGAFGIAPKCRILAVKIFHGDDLARDDRVADAIRYAAGIASVISCSWTGGNSPDVELALEDARLIGRKGKGSPVFCATGNEESVVGFPASSALAIGVGASTDQARLASYSNTGKEVDFVAPSSGGKADILTTDVSIPNRGFNTGNAQAGGADGLLTNSFGGTSSATPLAAGVAALVLSVKPSLGSDEVREVLRSTADKIGSGYNSKGHSTRFGFGRVNAAKALNSVS